MLILNIRLAGRNKFLMLYLLTHGNVWRWLRRAGLCLVAVGIDMMGAVDEGAE